MEGEYGNAACDTCGKDALIVIDGRGLCESCFHVRGSCCGEQGTDEDS